MIFHFVSIWTILIGYMQRLNVYYYGASILLATNFLVKFNPRLMSFRGYLGPKALIKDYSRPIFFWYLRVSFGRHVGATKLRAITEVRVVIGPEEDATRIRGPRAQESWLRHGGLQGPIAVEERPHERISTRKCHWRPRAHGSSPIGKR